MAKKSSCTRNAVEVNDDSLYVVYDDNQCQLVIAGIYFDDIASEVERYLEDNGYCEDDVEISVYKETSITVEVNSKPKVTVTRN